MTVDNNSDTSTSTNANNEEEPAYKEGECFLWCFNGTFLNKFYNYLTNGPYYNRMPEERVWEADELEDDHNEFLDLLRRHSTPLGTNSSPLPSTRSPRPPQRPHSAMDYEQQSTQPPPPKEAEDEEEHARQLQARMKRQVAELRLKNEFIHDELLDLPFQPMSFVWYIVELLFGTLIVGQYIITMLIALMVTANELEKFPDEVSSSMPALAKSVLVMYPLCTMLLLLMASCEISMRKFMYYRLLTIGIIMDWDNAGVRKMRWFNWYFGLSWAFMSSWTIYAAAVSYKDRSSASITSWAIIQIQTILLYSWYWNRIEAAERYLVTVNELMETAPFGAKALIDSCDVIRERDLAKMMVKLCRKLWNPFSDVSPLLLDLAKLRKERRVAFGPRLRRLSSTVPPQVVSTQKTMAADVEAGFWQRMGTRLVNLMESIFVVRLYASVYALLITLRRFMPWQRSKLRLWPYSGDLTYFTGIWVTTFVCYLIVVMIEAYALWLAFRPDDITILFGSKPCRECFRYLFQTGKSCAKRDACSSAAMRAANTTFCLGEYLMRSNETYALGEGQVSEILYGVCPTVWANTSDYLLRLGLLQDTTNALS